MAEGLGGHGEHRLGITGTGRRLAVRSRSRLKSLYPWPSLWHSPSLLFSASEGTWWHRGGENAYGFRCMNLYVAESWRVDVP